MKHLQASANTARSLQPGAGSIFAHRFTGFSNRNGNGLWHGRKGSDKEQELIDMVAKQPSAQASSTNADDMLGGAPLNVDMANDQKDGNVIDISQQRRDFAEHGVEKESHLDLERSPAASQSPLSKANAPVPLKDLANVVENSHKSHLPISYTNVNDAPKQLGQKKVSNNSTDKISPVLTMASNRSRSRRISIRDIRISKEQETLLARPDCKFIVLSMQRKLTKMDSLVAFTPWGN